MSSLYSFIYLFKDLFHAEMEALSWGYIGEIQLVKELKRETRQIILSVWEYKNQTSHRMCDRRRLYF